MFFFFFFFSLLLLSSSPSPSLASASSLAFFFFLLNVSPFDAETPSNPGMRTADGSRTSSIRSGRSSSVTGPEFVIVEVLTKEGATMMVSLFVFTAVFSFRREQEDERKK